MSVIRRSKNAYDRLSFHFIPDCFKTQRMCIKVVEEDPWWLKDVPDKFKTQEIYDKAVRGDPRYLELIPVHFKTQQMYIKALKKRHGCCGVSQIILRLGRCVKGLWKNSRRP